jgi:hypothetical protein
VRERKKRGPEAQDEVRSNLRTTPSQAEGERSTVEQDLCMQDARARQANPEDECELTDSEPHALETQLPSQAEGGRQTVEEDLAEKSRRR